MLFSLSVVTSPYLAQLWYRAGIKKCAGQYTYTGRSQHHECNSALPDDSRAAGNTCNQGGKGTCGAHSVLHREAELFLGTKACADRCYHSRDDKQSVIYPQKEGNAFLGYWRAMPLLQGNKKVRYHAMWYRIFVCFFFRGFILLVFRQFKVSFPAAFIYASLVLLPLF